MQAKSLSAGDRAARPVRDCVFIQYDHQPSSPGTNVPARVHTLIDGRYRLSVFHGTGWGELYDLRKRSRRVRQSLGRSGPRQDPRAR